MEADSPIRTLEELVARMKAKPGVLSYASSGNYGPTHLPAEMFLRAAGAQALHVPFQGGAAMLVALQGGQVDFMMLGRTFADPHVNAGKLRYLAAFDPRRWDSHPAVPTLQESGYQIDYLTWSGAFAPAGTPPAVLDRWRSALRSAAATPGFAQAAGQAGGFMDGEAFEAFARKDALALQAVVRAIGPVK